MKFPHAYIHDASKNSLQRVSDFPSPNGAAGLMAFNPNPMAFQQNSRIVPGLEGDLAVFNPMESGLYFFRHATGSWDGPFPLPGDVYFYSSIFPLSGGKLAITGVTHLTIVEIASGNTIESIPLPPEFADIILFSPLGGPDGSIALLGGVDQTTLDLNAKVFRRTQANPVWVEETPLPQAPPLFFSSFVSNDGFFYVMGGVELDFTTPSQFAMRIDLMNWTVESLPPLPTGSGGLGAYAGTASFNSFVDPLNQRVISLEAGATDWKIHSLPLPPSVFSAFDESGFLFWSSTGSNDDGHFSKIHFFSNYEPISYDLTGGNKPYSFETQNAGWLFESSNLYIPKTGGKHRVIVRDHSGKMIRSPVIQAY